MGKAILELLVFSIGYTIGGFLGYWIGIKLMELHEFIEDKIEERRRHGKSKKVF